ncbi:MAG: response regulator transcription factor [Candidatus Limnocylindria bacterium]
MSIRVLLIEDHPIFAEGLVLALSADPDVAVVGVATTMAQGERLATEERPDVALVDFHLPDGDGPEIARRLRGIAPGVAVVIVSGDESDEALRQAIGAGAVGYLLKSEPSGAVVRAVRRAAAGETLVDPGQLRRLAAPPATPPESAPSLTAREREILELIGEGFDNADIAERLVISVHTVRHHVGNLFEKLEAHSKLELAAKAHRAGLLRRA